MNDLNKIWADHLQKQKQRYEAILRDYRDTIWQQFNSMMEPVPKSLFPSEDDPQPDHIISK